MSSSTIAVMIKGSKYRIKPSANQRQELLQWIAYHRYYVVVVKQQRVMARYNPRELNNSAC